MAPSDKDRIQRGFTLIEVLVAFVILALFLGAVLPSLSASLSATRTSNDTLTATAYAQSLIAGVGVEGLITEGEFTNTLEQTRFTSRLTVRPYGEPAAAATDARLYEVTARIGWRDGVRRRTVSLTTLRYGTGQ